MNDARPLPHPTLVVGDIHNRIEQADAVLEQLRGRYRSVVFLGDYFDSFGDSTYDARRTARWLAESIQAPNRVHLMGNHDVSYLYPAHPQTGCPGWTPSKQRAIAAEFFCVEARGKFRIATKVGAWLLSHAGFTRKLAHGWSAEEALVEADVAQVCLGRSARYVLLNDDVNRGGTDSVAGILWTDFLKTFEPVAGLHQIVGHTPAVGAIRGKHLVADGSPIESVVFDNGMRAGPGAEQTCGFQSMNWCIDCDLKMVALIDEDAVQFVTVG